MNTRRAFTTGLVTDGAFLLFSIAVLDTGEFSIPLILTGVSHATTAAILYYRGERRGRFSKMDVAFLRFGPLVILPVLIGTFPYALKCFS